MESEGGIAVQYNNGWRYTYDASTNSSETIADMISRAREGKGLATYIAKNKPRYTSKAFIK
jgi:hypothetical protein